MWPPWLSSKPTRHRRFSTYSTFKDIETLLHEDNRRILHHKKHLLLPSIFDRVRISTSVLRSLDPTPQKQQPIILIYFTSLRIVRRTFEDCRTIRSILGSFRIPIDERDVSMDASFLNELKEILGTNSVSLPRVFVNGRYVGGVEEVRRLNECGELKKLIGVGKCAIGCVGGVECCVVCDGHRFVVCEKCDGSHKVFVEKLGFRSCSECNLNGLVCCPSCFASKRLL